MKSMRREPLLGAIRNTLIIILAITIIGCMANKTTTKQTETSNPINIEKLKEHKLIKKIEDTEKIVTQPIETPTIYIYDITPEDRETLARLVCLESNTESLECQKAIASVVINRLNSGYWGNTINSVIYAHGQFTPAAQIPYTTPNSTNYEAVDYVLTNGVTLPSYCLYFRASYHFSWRGYVPYVAIGNTYFGYMAKDKQ